MTPPPSAGYSGTPLAKKLGYKPAMEVCMIDAPAGYRALVAPLPEGVRFVPRVTAGTDMVHAFLSRKARLAEVLQACRATLGPDAMLWISWPKKAARVPTDITEDAIRAAALPLGFVDVKVCAVDQVWSGLKLVVRKELRPSRTKAR
jgi:hypothetical protein